MMQIPAVCLHFDNNFFSMPFYLFILLLLLFIYEEDLNAGSSHIARSKSVGVNGDFRHADWSSTPLVAFNCKDMTFY